MKVYKQRGLTQYLRELKAGESRQVSIDPEGVSGWSEATIRTLAKREGCKASKELHANFMNVKKLW